MRDELLLLAQIRTSPPRIFARHLFPNVLNTVMVLATFEVSVVILFEATLSLLGLGASTRRVMGADDFEQDGRPFLPRRLVARHDPRSDDPARGHGRQPRRLGRDRLDPHLQRAEQ